MSNNDNSNSRDGNNAHDRLEAGAAITAIAALLFVLGVTAYVVLPAILAASIFYEPEMFASMVLCAALAVAISNLIRACAIVVARRS